MDGIEFAKEIVNEVNEKVKRRYWTNEQIDKYFAKRSAKEILDNRTTCFMNPCLDLTLVSAAIMLSRYISYDFVIEEHLPATDFNFDKSKLTLKDFNFNRLHFALEFQHEDEEYGINYKRENEVHIFKGKYNGREGIPTAQIIRIPGEQIDPYKPIYNSLGYKTLEELIKNKFKGYSLESNLNRLKQDNSQENYRCYYQRYKDEVNIILTPQNPPSP